MIEKTSEITARNHTIAPGRFSGQFRSLLPWLSAKKTDQASTDETSACRSPQSGNKEECLLRIEKLQQRWPDQAEALFRVDSVSWHSDQHIWLQGANGSGKTTLMRLISGLEPVQEGEILSPVEINAIEPRICYLHQTPYLFAGSVERNLNFVIRSLRADKRAAARQARELGLKLAGLEKLRDQNAVTLSGGERQRLALLRAWLLQPDLLLLDEPAANLDADSVELMHRLVVDLIDKGAVIMVSSHQKNLLTDLCNVQWEIHSGLLNAGVITG